jgi:sigma-B regulation protein RsbU (phosphoserine phosphatase)
LRTAALYESTPQRVLERLNDVLLADPDRRQLCTAVCAHLSPHNGVFRVKVACAGHPAPYLLRRGEGAQPAGATGTLLGAFDEVQWDADEIELRPGDVLVLYTDGVTDTTGAEGQRFGQDRLAEVLAGCEDFGPEEIARAIDAVLMRFEEGPQRDDLALLVLRADADSR